MAQGYFLSGRGEKKACFDYFFRDLPFGGGYVIFTGLSDLLTILEDFHFHDDELRYLADQGFQPAFIDYLRDFAFTATIHAPKEGEIVFPTEPVVRVEGSIIEAQILETLLLNILNFESLIATKARRMKYAAGNRQVIDFGLRRAQGYGGLQASKAAFIGGVEATSNVYTSFTQQIPPSGTMAHSWIQSYGDEAEAFRAYANYFPDNTILLVDTYDTLSSGVPNAIKVAKEMEEDGHKLKGIRLDSGDLAYYSRKARNQLDRAGLEYVKIAASNQLDEYLINSLLGQGAPIDLFGVGTRLVTGQESPALDGVYKLVSFNGEPTLKISENVEKVTLPGCKHILRYLSIEGQFLGDGVLLDEEDSVEVIYHPFYPNKHTNVADMQSEPLLHTVMEEGRRTGTTPSAQESARYAEERFQQLKGEHKRFQHPHTYKVGITKKLMDLRDRLKEQYNPK
jgi:nicotinate phosphoribosyltransferase